MVENDFPMALPLKAVLAGQFVIQKVLGQGGFGITYEALDHKSGDRVAVKEYFPDTLATRSASNTVTPYTGERGESFEYGKSCFLQEAETLAEFIGIENIVRVRSYFEENGTAYFVMDYVEGTSFDKYIKEQGGKIPYEETERILLPIIDALGIVHSKGIVHRDVTPDNIYITNDGTIKLLDFGAARYSLGDRSRSLDVVLKHGFAPREQYARHGRQGPYTDVYSLAATFYFAITGKRPPDAIDRIEEDSLMPFGSVGVSIPPYKEAVIFKALSMSPADRYQSMPEFKAALIGSNAVAVTEDIEFDQDSTITDTIDYVSFPAQDSSVEEPTNDHTYGKKPLFQSPLSAKNKTIYGLSAFMLFVIVASLVTIYFVIIKPREEEQMQDQQAFAEPLALYEESNPETGTEKPDEKVIPEEIRSIESSEEYRAAMDLYYDQKYAEAAWAFSEIGDYDEVNEMVYQCERCWRDSLAIVAVTDRAPWVEGKGSYYIDADGEVVCFDQDRGNSNMELEINEYGEVTGQREFNTADHGKVVSITNNTCMCALFEDGFVSNSAYYNGLASDWRDVIQITNSSKAALLRDGSVVIANSYYGLTDGWMQEAASWTNIIQLDEAEWSEGGGGASFLAGLDDSGKIHVVSDCAEWVGVVDVIEYIESLSNIRKFHIDFRLEGQDGHCDWVLYVAALDEEGNLHIYDYDGPATISAEKIKNFWIQDYNIYLIDEKNNLVTTRSENVIIGGVVYGCNRFVISQSGTIYKLDGSKTGAKTEVRDVWFD